jgi:hypothetical protein
MGQISRPPERSDPYPVKTLGQMLLQKYLVVYWGDLLPTCLCSVRVPCIQVYSSIGIGCSSSLSFLSGAMLHFTGQVPTERVKFSMEPVRRNRARQEQCDRVRSTSTVIHFMPHT